MGRDDHRELRPPLWLASAAVVAAWAAIYDIAAWFIQFARQPVHPDFRIFYVAAEAGLRYGWSSIYDVSTLRSLSASFPSGQNYVTSALPFIHPPLLAWLIAPLTVLPVPAAYAVWCAVLLAALVWAWYIAAPYSGLRKVALLLLALAIWPVLDAFYFGQPSTLQLALVAAAWWLCVKDRPLAAGAALALATALKPHTVILLPLALAASGRYRPFFSWAAVCSVLAAAFALALGPTGLNNWWQALVYGQTDPGQSLYTLAYLFGSGPVSYTLEALQGAAALVIARRGRDDVNVVFAAGIVGSLAFAFHLHQYDYIELILAAWLVLRSAPPLWHRLWLLAGVATLLAIDLGQPIPQLAWDLGWLVILWMNGYARRTEPSSIRVQSGL
ncbi:MAG TPA: glycosyltransferase family 87 protein [Candidatus Dormibacteraeota bacterium]|nr:glycosyltransferase family 87 protein [Candidatus Dormibacteraeota bacterium]